MKHIIFNVLISIYKVLPFQYFFLNILKRNGMSRHKIYKDLRFAGVFKINEKIYGNQISFKMMNFKGYIENETFWQGLFNTFEPESGYLWVLFSKKADVIFDIGANTGIYSLVSKSVNKHSVIYAFEPSRNTHSKLIQNIELNSFDINVYDLALSDINGKQIFYDSPSDVQTSASLSPEKNKNWDLFQGEIWEYEVDTLTLSQFVKDNGIKKIDLIKLDVEMHEHAVLGGYLEYLNIHLPVIFIEILNNQIAKVIYDYTNENYDYYQLLENKKIRKVNNFEIVMGVWNYLLIPKTKFNLFHSEIKAFKIEN
jgi:FkbM family methyltransferase